MVNLFLQFNDSGISLFCSLKNCPSKKWTKNKQNWRVVGGGWSRTC